MRMACFCREFRASLSNVVFSLPEDCSIEELVSQFNQRYEGINFCSGLLLSQVLLDIRCDSIIAVHARLKGDLEAVGR